MLLLKKQRLLSGLRLPHKEGSETARQQEGELSLPSSPARLGLAAARSSATLDLQEGLHSSTFHGAVARAERVSEQLRLYRPESVETRTRVVRHELVGRESELQRLTGALDAVMQSTAAPRHLRSLMSMPSAIGLADASEAHAGAEGAAPPCSA